MGRPGGAPENLIQIQTRPPEEQLRMRRKGAETTNAKRRERKTLKEDLLILLESKQAKILNGLCDKASKGDAAAVKLIAELIGENGASNANINITSDEQTRRDAWQALTGKDAETSGD